jgi:hypothetical protein
VKSKEYRNFLKWRREKYPLLRSSDQESNMMWDAYRAASTCDEEGCYYRRRFEKIRELVV